MADVLAKVGGIWRDLTTNWMSFRLSDSPNTSRRTLHPLWEQVQEAADRLGPAMHIKRDLQATPTDIEWYRAHMAGCMAGFAARLGQPDLVTALLVLQAMIIEYWAHRHWGSEYQCKRIELGYDDASKESGDGQG